MSDSELKALRDFLSGLRVGPLTNSDERQELEGLLASCWDNFDGASENSMAAWKLRGRMEKVRWEPPNISFQIERHGITVMGSSRAEVFAYAVDVESGVVSSGSVGIRQRRPMQGRLDVRPLVAEIVELVVAGQEDPRLRWADGRAEVLIGQIIPAGSAVKETLQGRRKRLALLLAEEMKRHGWERLDGRRHIFHRSAETI